MATATQPAITQPGLSQDEDSSWDQRGTTTIPARVVAQIAAKAAYEIGNVGSNADGLLGIGARRNFASRPEAQCELYGQAAVLHLDLGLVFPIPLSSAIEDLRTHVRSRVEHLTGLSVGKITIKISWLNPSSHVGKSLK
ncbi:hypothetical protein HMPREF1531_00914 [Propionibacterium sp. oral taxon 192 str. F0372]|uniref:Asp23/Gls24 family envelope stress response protein n=1 Tax=Propionibacterium sp. oral taxon 192 TaxID=671222 RepID=UPI0003543CBA|nr:Asp23/Gls24 family envelope stress response protein [Propionibacterium sp. oral taxon 192]EPH06264.1 hypothetical protein HMPREF1531_00914 [Propionibacterium sp. oral taxon 192 str. F0372]